MGEIRRGTCFALFAYDIGFSIDLAEAQRRITEFTQRETLKHRRRAPQYFQYQPPPVRFTQGGESVRIGDLRTNPAAEVVLYDFGAASVIYSIPIEGPLDALVPLSSLLYENAQLLEDSRKRVDNLVRGLASAISKGSISTVVEDYLIFHIAELKPPSSSPQFVQHESQAIAQILRATTGTLSADEVEDALSHHISFGSHDVVIVDWNAAIVVDPEAEDTLAVLEFANVELMEMRYLDRRLDEALGLAYETLAKPKRNRFAFGSQPAELQRIAQWQVDSAILFEGVNNALKLLGDQYLARLYRKAADRFHLAEWDATIIRKLETLNSIYGKISDQVTTRRMEVLEWIIIILITVSILLPFFGILTH
jgi:hypothetical protein